jgi:hypothetical protein
VVEDLELLLALLLIKEVIQFFQQSHQQVVEVDNGMVLVDQVVLEEEHQDKVILEVQETHLL